MNIDRQATEELDRLAGLVGRIKVGMLTTIGPDGSLRSRPLQTLQMDAEGRLWFFTEADSPKTGEMEAHDQQVCLSYADPDKMSYVSVSGTGRLVRERERMRELWTPLVKAWFPRGLDDPALALLEVRLDKAEFWDSPASVKTAGARSAAPGDEAKAPKP